MTLKRKIVLWSAIGLACLSIGVTLLKRYFANKDNADFVAQLKLAQADGLPTNAAEFAATIKPAPAAENAASDYRSMRVRDQAEGLSYVDPSKAEWNLLNRPSPTTMNAARKILLANQSALSFIDAATKKPRCWFDRDWSLGPAVPEPEFARMTDGARLIALRGAVEFAQGHDGPALANDLEIFQISKHAGEEGTADAAVASRSIYEVGLQQLADLAFIHPIQSYIEALNRAVATYPKPDVRAENRGNLFIELRGIEMLETPEGRNKLGLKSDDGPDAGDVLTSSFLSQPVAKVALVKAERDYWNGLKLPPKQREQVLSDALDRIDSACKAFPMLDRDDSSVSSRSQEPDPESDWEATRQQYSAIARALAGGGRAKVIKTDDLKSPYDGVPLKYHFDGKQMTFEVSRPNHGGSTIIYVPEKQPG